MGVAENSKACRMAYILAGKLQQTEPCENNMMTLVPQLASTPEISLPKVVR